MSDIACSLHIRDVSKSYGRGIRVLSDVTLEVPVGEICTIIGPSGSGKTTLLRLIAGLDAPDGGTITLNGTTIDTLPPHKRDMAMVFQGAPLYPHMTVWQNIVFSLRMRGATRRVIRQRVDDLLPWLKLETLLKRRPHTLSGGERQRVALAKALVCRPNLFLLDEPLSHVDGQHRAAIRARLKTHLHKLGIPCLYVTHDQHEAMALADRVCVLHQGRVQQMGTPLDIYRRPVNRFVADFFGSPPINFLEGRVELNEGTVLLRQLSGDSIAMPGEYGRLQGKSITLGLRPEHLSLVAEEAGLCRKTPSSARERAIFSPGKDGEAGDVCSIVDAAGCGQAEKGPLEARSSFPTQPNTISASITLIERLGAQTVVHADTPKQTTFIISAPSADSREVGDQIRIAVDWTQVHLFE